jgi:protein gp37
MAAQTSIEWTDATWNPATGCTRISAGCARCYAERMAKRLKAMGQPHYQRGFKVTLHEDALDLPLGWKRPQVIFVNSMSDLFHEDIPDDFILRVFEIMRRADWHVFQVLTKRSERLREVTPRLDWPPNVWMGVTVESADYLGRLDDLRETGAHVKFVSFEPLIGPVGKARISGLDWVIAGGESGPGARPMKPEWARGIRDRCRKARIPFFFKQWGGVNKKKAGRVLDGKTWDQMPTAHGAGAFASAATR